VVDRVRVTTGVARLLAVLVVEPGEWRYGLDLMRATGQASGSLYPILTRLLEAGWLESEWEQVDPVAEGRPARRYYRLTPDGLSSARLSLAELTAHLSPRRGRRPGPAGAAGSAHSIGVSPLWTVEG
jgi:PadR family transcriptional regulator PadR